MWPWLKIASGMTSLACAILIAFCCVSCALAGGFNQPFGAARYYHDRGEGATTFSNVALVGTFVAGAFAIVKSDARMGRAAAGLFASSLIVPLVVAYIPARIRSIPHERKYLQDQQDQEKELEAKEKAFQAKEKARRESEVRSQ